eukprot:3940765-Rhodomonas_salina.3
MRIRGPSVHWAQEPRLAVSIIDAVFCTSQARKVGGKVPRKVRDPQHVLLQPVHSTRLSAGAHTRCERMHGLRSNYVAAVDILAHSAREVARNRLRAAQVGSGG